MEAREIRVNDPVEALLVEQLLAMVREMRVSCRTAPHGHGLQKAEELALTRGRELIRRSLEEVLNDEAHEVEKRGRRRGPVRAAEPASIGGPANDGNSRRRAP